MTEKAPQLQAEWISHFHLFANQHTATARARSMPSSGTSVSYAYTFHPKTPNLSILKLILTHAPA
jgi:hypothetical protein